MSYIVKNHNGAGFQKEIEASELSEYQGSENWEIVDGPSNPEFEEEGLTEVEELAEGIANSFAERGRLTGKDYQEELAEDIRDEYDLDAPDRLSEEEKESLKRVELAINHDPSYPNNRTELLHQLCVEEGKIPDPNEEPPEEMTEAEQERAFLEEMEKQNMDVSPEHPENKEISEMTGAEFKQIMAEAQSSDTEEELQRATQEEAPEELQPDPADIGPDEEKAELAAEGFSQWAERKNGDATVWEEFAQDLEKSKEFENTNIVSLDGGKKRIETSDDELVEELKQAHDNTRHTRLLDIRDNGSVVAEVLEDEYDI